MLNNEERQKLIKWVQKDTHSPEKDINAFLDSLNAKAGDDRLLLSWCDEGIAFKDSDAVWLVLYGCD